MKKTILISVLAALCLNFRLSAQSTPSPLQPGDTLPALTFTQLANTKSQRIATKDYAGQLLIFDFWATWCSTCIKKFPEVEALQRQYDGRVRFIAVNSRSTLDSDNKVRAFFKKHPEFRFPSITGDTVLDKLFPHHAVPHYAWIRNNVVLAVTGPEAIHRDTIAAVLEGRARPAAFEDRMTDLSRPIFYKGNGGEPDGYAYRSLLSPYTPGLASYVYRGADENGQVSRLLYANQTVSGLLSAAYPELGRAEKNRIMTAEGTAPGILQDSTGTAWNTLHRYVYEAIFPPRTRGAAQRLMQEDLRRYFSLTLDSALMEKPCLVFSRTRPTDPKAPEAAATNWYEREPGTPVTFRHYPLDDLLHSLEEVSGLPLLNETGGNPAVDLNLRRDNPDAQELNKALRKQGLRVIRASRRIKVYLIRQVPEQPNR